MSITITIENPLDQQRADLIAELERLSGLLKAAINAPAVPDAAPPIVEALGVMDTARKVIARQAQTEAQRAALEAYARAYAERLAVQNVPAELEQLVRMTRALHQKAQTIWDASKLDVGRMNNREIDAAHFLTTLEIPSSGIDAIRTAVSAAFQKHEAAAK